MGKPEEAEGKGRKWGEETVLAVLTYQTHGEGWRLGTGADVDLHITPVVRVNIDVDVGKKKKKKTWGKIKLSECHRCEGDMNEASV